MGLRPTSHGNHAARDPVHRITRTRTLRRLRFPSQASPAEQPSSSSTPPQTARSRQPPWPSRRQRTRISRAPDPSRAIRAFFVGETAKVAVVIVLFVVVLKTMKVVPLAMLGSEIATFVVFWFLLFDGRGRAQRDSREKLGASP